MTCCGISERFQAMVRTQPNLYYTVVIEDDVTHQVVGSATLVKEMHFIRQCASVSTGTSAIHTPIKH